MRLVYNFTIKPNKTTSLILANLTYASARLFNVGNYERKKYSELGFEKMPNWYEQKKRLKDNMWFKALPSQSAQDVLQRLNEGWRSYYKLLRTKGIKEPKPPYYKAKGSHYNVKYLNNSFKQIGNKIRLMVSKSQKEFIKEKYNLDIKYFYIKLEKEIKEIKQIEFKYVNDFTYEVGIIYEIDNEMMKSDNGHYVSIDLGICNLATIYDNKGYSFIISGNTYLNTLYYYNKRIAHYQSIYDLQNKTEHKCSKRIQMLYEKKKRVISYIMHASTKRIVDYCLTNDITKVIIGDITNIRENKDLGHINNQKLHSLPFKELYTKLEYKLRLKGIILVYQKEYYTSTCPVDAKEVSKEYQDKGRKKRGLYKQGNTIYNADSVGAYNIMKLHIINSKLNVSMVLKGLSNPPKTCICVTS